MSANRPGDAAQPDLLRDVHDGEARRDSPAVLGRDQRYDELGRAGGEQPPAQRLNARTRRTPLMSRLERNLITVLKAIRYVVASIAKKFIAYRQECRLPAARTSFLDISRKTGGSSHSCRRGNRSVRSSLFGALVPSTVPK
jgi:hypothetical protein